MGDGIAENQVFASVEKPFLAFREMIQAEETAPLVCIFVAHVGEGVLDSSRIVLEADGKSSAGDIPLPDIPERFAALPEIRPRLFLLGQQIETKSGKTLHSFPAVESGIGLLLRMDTQDHSFCPGIGRSSPCRLSPYASLIHLLPGEDLGGPDLVLEGIVAVCLFDAEGRVGVPGQRLQR